MTLAGWIVLAYLAVSAWVATASFLYENEESGCRGLAFRSAACAALIMWILPAIFAVALIFPPPGRRD